MARIDLSRGNTNARRHDKGGIHRFFNLPPCPTPRPQWRGVNGARGYLSPVHSHYVFHAVCHVSSLCLEIMLLLFLLMRLLSRPARGIPDTRQTRVPPRSQPAIRVKDPRDPSHGSAKSWMLGGSVMLEVPFSPPPPLVALNFKWSGRTLMLALAFLGIYTALMNVWRSSRDDTSMFHLLQTLWFLNSMH